MKLRDWTVPAVLLLGCGNVALVASGPSVSVQIAERIRIQEARVPQIVDERLHVPLLRDRAAELLIVARRVRAQVAMELTQLTNQRNVRLGAIMEWENDLKEQVRGILEYLRQSESRPVRLGVVESVGYCPTGGYYCMIEGVDKVLTVGDRVGRIRVLKIGPEQVEFAKDGTTWAQGLGASAQPFWD